jgi:hypothetical protein
MDRSRSQVRQRHAPALVRVQQRVSDWPNCVIDLQCCGASVGYPVRRDATADYSHEAMHAALDINIPNYASAIVGAEQIVALISAL